MFQSCDLNTSFTSDCTDHSFDSDLILHGLSAEPQEEQLQTQPPIPQQVHAHYYGFRTRHLSCIEENDSDSHNSVPYDVITDADESFKKIVEQNCTSWDSEDITTLDESQLYKIDSLEELRLSRTKEEHEYYWQSSISEPIHTSHYKDKNGLPAIMTASCYGELNNSFGSDGSSVKIQIKNSNEPIYATPEKRRDHYSMNQSQSSSIYGDQMNFSLASSFELINGRCIATPMELSTLSIDESAKNACINEDIPVAVVAKCISSAQSDLQSIRRLLDQETSGAVCPSCRISFDKGKRRKLIDTCGHERCYSCMFRNDQCPMCINSSLKDVDCINTQGYDTGIGGSTSTIVSPLGSPQPQLRSQLRTNAAALSKYMQNRQESISPDLRYTSAGKLPKSLSSTTGTTNTTASPSGNEKFGEIGISTAASFATPPPARRRFFNHKNLRNALTGGHRRSSSNGCPIDTSSILSGNNPLETSTCSDSVVTRRRRKALNSSNLLGGSSENRLNRLSLAGTSIYAGHLSSLVFGKIKSLWNVNSTTTSAGLNQLAGGVGDGINLPSVSNEKTDEELHTRLGLFLNSAKSTSSTNINPESHTDSPEYNDVNGRFKAKDYNKNFGSQFSVATKDDIVSITEKLKAFSVSDRDSFEPPRVRKTVVRRSARSQSRNTTALYKPPTGQSVQLALKPLFFEVPLQEPDPPFIGRQWLLRELSNILTSTETPGVLINGNPGTGKTALILQLVEYSCFGRRKDVAYTETDGIYCQINIGHDRLKALASHIVGYHFCQADTNLTCLVPDFVHSLAAQLCQAPQLIAYRQYLINEPHLQDILSVKECIADAERVMRMAILEPLTLLKRSGRINSKTCIILIDALCEAEYHRPDHGHTIATFLAKMTQYFPTWLKVVATVRTQMLEFVKGLSFTKMTLDSWASNDLLQKDMLDYITFRVNHSSDIQNNIAGTVKENTSGQLKFIGHLQSLTKGSFLYAKLILDLIERGQLVIKSTGYKILPVSLAQIFLLHFNLRFPTGSSFEKTAPILNVCLAALSPLTLNEIYYTICSLKTDEIMNWDEFLQRFKFLDGFLVKRIDNTYMFFHPSFREWLIRRDDGESLKFLCDFRLGHAAIAFRLSRLQAPLDPEQTLELGHHILKAHIYRNSKGPPSPRDMQSFWVASVTDSISAALGSLRNVYNPNMKVSRLLLLAGASPHHQTDFMGDATILCIAAHEGIVPLVSLLLEFGADVERTNSQGCTPLILAAMKGHCDVLRLLVAAGSILGQTDTTQRCALVHAARTGRLNVVKYLLASEWSPRPNTNDVSLEKAVQQALIGAASQDHTTIVEDLLEMMYVHVNDIEPLSGETALTAAAKNGCVDTVQVLLARGAKVDERNKSEITPLWIAVKEGHWAVAEKLLQNGAFIDKTVTASKKTPLMIAAEEGLIGILELLIDRGATMDAEDNEGFTALSWACLRGRFNATKCLIEKGSNKEHTDHNGRTPLDLAAYQGSASLVQYLLDQGAHIEHVDVNGMRPLDRAIACRNIQVVQVFLKRGAKLGPTTWSMAMGKPEILVVLFNKLLEDGNVLYRKNRFQEAAHRYQYALKKITNIETFIDKNSVFTQLRANLLLNLSRCKRKLNELEESIELATQAIDQKPVSYEGYYARAKAKMELCELNEALVDANEAIQKAAQSSVLPEVVEVLRRIQNELLCRINYENHVNISAVERNFQNEITDL